MVFFVQGLEFDCVFICGVEEGVLPSTSGFGISRLTVKEVMNKEVEKEGGEEAAPYSGNKVEKSEVGEVVVRFMMLFIISTFANCIFILLSL
jgi:hypothetical protein